MRNLIKFVGAVWSVLLLCSPVLGQNYYYGTPQPDAVYHYPPGENPWPPRQPGDQRQQQPQAQPQPHPQDPRMGPGPERYGDQQGETILRDQIDRSMRPPESRPQVQMYDPYPGEAAPDEEQVRRVMAEAHYVGTLVTKKNGKPFLVIDKRNYQFYLYSRAGRLLRIGPVAVGKGNTQIGSFETPVGIFPIRSKIPIDDWIRPDWYFLEENEPIPQRYEDRRVPGFFRYKLVFEGTRYIHYAEATGGRLTHGCLGLDWADAEAVFHTMEVGSYCIIVDGPFLLRLAKGEFPIKKPEEPKKPVEQKKPEGPPATVAAKAEAKNAADSGKVFNSMW